MQSSLKSPLKWLQWATIDLENGLGGTEVHARCLSRELRNLGVDVHYSSDPRDLGDPSWDVVHTRGCFLPLYRACLGSGNRRPVWIHHFHGETLVRMRALHEWAWPGGYLAAAREYAGLLRADIVMADHAEMAPYQLAGTLGKARMTTSNGWNASQVIDSDPALPRELEEKLKGRGAFWAFVGRGSDPIKGSDRLKRFLTKHPEIRLVVAPGEGFEGFPGIIGTGRLSSAQVIRVMELASGLLLPSLYEGFGIVAIEALSAGIPVVSSPLSGLMSLPKTLDGLVFAADMSDESWEQAYARALRLPQDSEAKLRRAQANRQILPTWAQVAQKVLETTCDYISRHRRKAGPKPA